SGALRGVGHVLTPEQQLVAIDLDKCVEPDGTLATWAAEIVDRLDSYAGLSPSRRGGHILTRATLPWAGRRPGRTGFFTAARFIPLTGLPVGGAPAAVRERQHAVDMLVAELGGSAAGSVSRPHPVKPCSIPPAHITDESLIRRALGAPASGFDFALLWHG